MIKLKKVKFNKIEKKGLRILKLHTKFIESVAGW